MGSHAGHQRQIFIGEFEDLSWALRWGLVCGYLLHYFRYDIDRWLRRRVVSNQPKFAQEIRAAAWSQERSEEVERTI